MFHVISTTIIIPPNIPFSAHFWAEKADSPPAAELVVQKDARRTRTSMLERLRLDGRQKTQ